MAVTEFPKCVEENKHRCKIFHCDHRKDRYCCFYCGRKGCCKNPCQNNPKRCNAAFEQEDKNAHKKSITTKKSARIRG